MSANQEIWCRATLRASALKRIAEEHHPTRGGYVHDLRSDGWPDLECEIVVSKRIPDRRTRQGFRLELICIISDEATE